jgi:hypothetical protein
VRRGEGADGQLLGDGERNGEGRNTKTTKKARRSTKKAREAWLGFPGSRCARLGKPSRFVSRGAGEGGPSGFHSRSVTTLGFAVSVCEAGKPSRAVAVFVVLRAFFVVFVFEALLYIRHEVWIVDQEHPTAGAAEILAAAEAEDRHFAKRTHQTSGEARPTGLGRVLDQGSPKPVTGGY